MENRYNAFISYRHAPLDSRIAQRIHRDLEHFHIPKAIQKQCGIKKIDRIFRDKEELPISVNLNDDIETALAQSEFLIVICSPRTGDSIWVQKEIETFLKTHGRDHILTVLAEGEPENVIPKILLSETKVDPQTGENIEVLLEPLSCDYRLPRGKARRLELPRIVAGLLHCRYDDLRQRQRLYRARRLAAGLTAALVLTVSFAGYAIHSGLQIRRNYEQSLVNQSRYLAAESQKAMESGDRLTAIALALEALPDEERNRPVIPEAELALTQSLGAYSTGNEIEAVGAYRTSHPLSNFWIAGSGKYLCTQDVEGEFLVWDVETYSVLWSLSDLHVLAELDVYFLPDDRMVMLGSGNAVCCYSLQDGRELWRFDEFPVYQMRSDWDRKFLLCISGCDIISLDPDTGERRWLTTVDDFPVEIDSFSVSFPGENCFSEDAKYALLDVGDWFAKTYYPLLVDLDTGVCSYVDVPFELIYSACFTKSGHVVLETGKGNGFSGTFSTTGFDHFLSVSQETTADLICVDPYTGQKLWQTQMAYYTPGNNGGVAVCDDGNILYSAGELCARLDAQSGEILGQCHVPAPIVRAIDDGGKARMILSDGTICFYRYAENKASSIQYFVDSLFRGDAKNSIHNKVHYFVAQRKSNCVIRYATPIKTYYDPFEMEQDPGDWRVAYTQGHEALLACGEGGTELYRFNLEDQTARFVADMGQLGDWMDILYFSPEEGRAILTFPGCVYEVDVNTGAQKEIVLPQQEEIYMNDSITYEDGILRYLVYKEIDLENDQLYLYSYDLASGQAETVSWTLPRDQYQLKLAGQSVLIYPKYGNDVRYLTSLDGTVMTPLEWPMNDDPAFAYNAEKDLLCTASTNRIIFLKPDGTQMGQFETDANAVYVRFEESGNSLYVIDDTLRLLHYTPDGELLSSMELYGNIGTTSSHISWDQPENGDLHISLGACLNIVKSGTNSVSTYVDGCVMFDEQMEKFLCYDSEPIAFRQFTIEELVQMGRDSLGNFRLQSPEQYGLE